MKHDELSHLSDSIDTNRTTANYRREPLLRVSARRYPETPRRCEDRCACGCNQGATSSWPARTSDEEIREFRRAFRCPEARHATQAEWKPTKQGSFNTYVDTLTTTDGQCVAFWGRNKWQPHTAQTLAWCQRCSLLEVAMGTAPQIGLTGHSLLLRPVSGGSTGTGGVMGACTSRKLRHDSSLVSFSAPFGLFP